MCCNSPSPPPAPDPYATANAQTQSNKETAAANAALNRVNQYTPWGSSTYAQAGSDTQGNPLWSQTVSLSPDQQKLLDSSNRISQQMANLGESQLGTVANAVGQQVDFSKASGVQNNPLASGVNTAGMPSYLTSAGGGNAQTSIGPSGSIQAGMRTPGNVQTGFNAPGSVQTGINTPGQVQGSVGTTQLQNKLGPNGQIQAGINTAGTENLTRGVSSGGIQGQIDMSDVPALVSGDALRGQTQEAQRAAYNLQMQYLNPQYEQQQRDLEVRLANQGVMQNSEAWDRAMDQFGRQRTFDTNNAFNNSFDRGLAAQNQLYNQGLSSRQNMFGEATTRGNFANSAQAQGFNQQMANAQLNNTAAGQLAAQRLAQMQAGNNAQQQGFAQNLGTMQAENEAKNQQFGQNLQAGQFGNNAQGQMYAQALSSMQAGNAAQQQQFGQEQDRMQAANAAQQQQFNQAKDSMGMANAAQQQQFAQQMGQAELFNNAEAQNFAQRAANNASNNAARSELFNQGMMNAELQNSASAQAFNQSSSDRARQLNEMVQQQQLPLNVLNALRTGSQVTAPQFQGLPSVNQAGTDIAGLINQNYNQQMGIYNSQVGQQNGLMSGLFGLGSAAIKAGMIGSDRSIKQNITRIATRDDGLGVYRFEYKPEYQVIWGAGERIGVMADEVKEVYPHAVIRNPAGYDMVNYGALHG